jgi:hypothetical protein
MSIMTCEKWLVKSDANDNLNFESKIGKAKGKSCKKYYSKHRISAF